MIGSDQIWRNGPYCALGSTREETPIALKFPDPPANCPPKRQHRLAGGLLDGFLYQLTHGPTAYCLFPRPCPVSRLSRCPNRPSVFLKKRKY